MNWNLNEIRGKAVLILPLHAVAARGDHGDDLHRRERHKLEPHVGEDKTGHCLSVSSNPWHPKGPRRITARVYAMA